MYEKGTFVVYPDLLLEKWAGIGETLGSFARTTSRAHADDKLMHTRCASVRTCSHPD